MKPITLFLLWLTIASCDARRPTPTPSPPPKPSPTPEVIGLTYNGGITFSNGVNVAQGKLLTVTVQANSSTTSVVFTRDGTVVKTDTATPFDFAWTPTALAGHILSVTPKSASKTGAAFARTFNVVAGGPTPTATPTSTPTPTPATPTPSPTLPPTPTPSPTPTSTPSPSPSTSPSPTVAPGQGIASRYPNDKNIGSDPAVILADDFESYDTVGGLSNKWSVVQHAPNMRIATEAGNFYAGAKGLEMTLPVSTGEVANAIKKNLVPNEDVIFMRMYQKWDAGYSFATSNHNGISLSAKYLTAGTAPPADGTGFFLFLLQNNIEGQPMAGESSPGFAHFYSYWPKQRSGYGDHWYPTGIIKPGGNGDWLVNPAQYPAWHPFPQFLPQRDRWYCYEMMVRENTPGKNDGEVKAWVDGNVIADFPNLFMRSISTLKMDDAHIVFHSIGSTRANKKWFDNVVIARSYIGPMVKASPSPTPNPTPTSTPTPTATGTPTPTPPPPTPSPTISPTPSPTATPSPTVTPSPTSSPTPTPSPTPAQKVSASVTWNASDSQGVTGYIIVWGTASGNYPTSFDCGSELTARLVGKFDIGTTYYAAVKAYNASKVGVPSKEVSFTPDATWSAQLHKISIDRKKKWK